LISRKKISFFYYIAIFGNNNIKVKNCNIVIKSVFIVGFLCINIYFFKGGALKIYNLMSGFDRHSSCTGIDVFFLLVFGK